MQGIYISEYSPEKDIIYNLFVTYFGNPVLTKINDSDGYSVYIVKVPFMLLEEQVKFIVVLVYKDNLNIGHTEYLQSLKWTSFQTRILPDQYSLPIHFYTPSKSSPLNTEIIKTKKVDEASFYSCKQFPMLKITLLHTEKNKDYNQKGTIVTALET